MEERKKDVEEFWRTGALCPESNVQFGEGGAGTFSDGKLNTLVHDPDGRGREVLRLFVSHGAPEEFLYDSKPHVGTDKLIQVVRSLREEIQDLGGEFRFYTKTVSYTHLAFQRVSCRIWDHLPADRPSAGRDL